MAHGAAQQVVAKFVGVKSPLPESTTFGHFNAAWSFPSPPRTYYLGTGALKGPLGPTIWVLRGLRVSLCEVGAGLLLKP